MTTARSIAEVVSTGLCIGCGLCEAVTGGRVTMAMTPAGSLRPTPADDFSVAEERLLLAACPGVCVEPRSTDVPEQLDPIWGGFTTMRLAWAGDPDVRFRASTGGVLTALGMHLVREGTAAVVLHVGPDSDRSVRSRWVLSETPDEVLANAGSRYGPTAPLAGLGAVLDRREPFAVIAKPCDLGALHRFGRVDERVDEFCVARLALVCGGQSRLSKSLGLLDELGLEEDEVTLFRNRGHGNPGPTRIETSDGRSIERSYLELWGGEVGWDLESRCIVCPDALGEAADVAAADVWPGGTPTGDDDGFNGIIVRSVAGDALVASAVAAGDLVLGDPISPRTFDDFQPHQVRKKLALSARFEGRDHAGLPIVDAPGLRLAALGELLDPAARAAERDGTIRRARQGRFDETPPSSESRR